MQVLGVALVGLVVTLIFSMVGSGGSQVMVPLLFWMGLDFKSGAIPLGLLVAAITGFSAGAVYWRAGFVLKEVFWPFAISVTIGAPLGAIAHFSAPSKLIMIGFAISNMLVGLGVLRGGSMLKQRLSRRLIISLCLISGLLVGFFIGLIGRDGGPLIMAALVLVGYDTKKSAGTTTLIVAIGCAVAFFVHLPGATIGWELILAGSLASAVGSQIGSRLMSERLDSKTVRMLFAAVMFAVGAVILVQAL